MRCGILIGALAVGSVAFSQETAPPQRVNDQEHWISNSQLYSVLSLDYQVNPQQGWLVIDDGGNRFYVQANELFPEIRMMQAWGNTVNVTHEEINSLNSKLMGGRLFITAENKIQLVWEHSYHGMKMTSVGLSQSIERFRAIRDSVVNMIAEM